MSDITVTSTTDTPEAVALAAGEEVAAPPADEAGKKPEATGKESEAAGTDGDSETPPKQESDGTGEEKAPDKPKKKGGFQRRVDKLTRRAHEAENRAAELEQRLAAQEPAETPAEKPPVVEGEPNQENFDSYEEYIDARADWKFEQRLEQQRKEDRQKQATAAAQERAGKMADLADAARGKHEDYDEVLEAADDIQVSASLRDALVESENLPELQYHLVKNPAEVARLNALTPIAAAREIGKLEAKLTAAPPVEPPATPKPKSATKAPEPITPVGSGSSGSAKPLDQESYQDFKRRREAGEG